MIRMKGINVTVSVGYRLVAHYFIFDLVFLFYYFLRIAKPGVMCAQYVSQFPLFLTF